MASIYITEYTGIRALATPVVGNATSAQAVAIGAASAQSVALAATTTLVRVFAGAKCTINIGANPTATATNTIQLGEEQFDYFTVNPGEKIAVIERA